MPELTIQEFKQGAATGEKSLLEARLVAQSESLERGSLCIITEDQGDWHSEIKEVWYMGRKYLMLECEPSGALADDSNDVR